MHYNYWPEADSKRPAVATDLERPSRHSPIHESAPSHTRRPFERVHVSNDGLPCPTAAEPLMSAAAWCPEGLTSEDSSVCCLAQCGACGGLECGQRFGGRSGCCAHRIRLEAPCCAYNGWVAPCRMPSPLPHPSPPSSPPPPSSLTPPPPSRVPVLQCASLGGRFDTRSPAASAGSVVAAVDPVASQAAPQHGASHDASQQPPAPTKFLLVTSTARVGSNWLRSMLVQHPALAMGGELLSTNGLTAIAQREANLTAIARVAAQAAAQAVAQAAAAPAAGAAATVAASVAAHASAAASAAANARAAADAARDWTAAAEHSVDAAYRFVLERAIATGKLAAGRATAGAGSVGRATASVTMTGVAIAGSPVSHGARSPAAVGSMAAVGSTTMGGDRGRSKAAIGWKAGGPRMDAVCGCSLAELLRHAVLAVRPRQRSRTPC